MHAPHCGDLSTRRHCLLPFEARPSVVGELRRTIALQLVAWGAADLTDVATLAVSELATNVIRHVGPGTPAALVLESGEDGRIRIEVHDTSGEMPHRSSAAPDHLTGRGLSLVAAVSNGWFAITTPSGKAVCCEFTANGPQKPYDPHVARGSDAVQRYALHRGPAGTRPLANRPAAQAAATDLITDLLHWLAATGHDPDTVLDHAQTHFEAEHE